MGQDFAKILFQEAMALLRLEIQQLRLCYRARYYFVLIVVQFCFASNMLLTFIILSNNAFFRDLPTQPRAFLVLIVQFPASIPPSNLPLARFKFSFQGFSITGQPFAAESSGRRQLRCLDVDKVHSRVHNTRQPPWVSHETHV